MRVLLINYEYPPVGGGAANATWEIARAMVKLGHEPVVLTARYKHRQPDTANPGIKVIEVPAIRRRKDRCSIFEMTTFVLSATLRIRSILRREKIEGMIAFFSIPCGPIAWWGWRGTSIPYIVSLRGGDVPGMEPGLANLHKILRGLRRTVLRSARRVVANSSLLREAAVKAEPVAIDIIPNGVDVEYWRPSLQAAPQIPVRFLCVGRLQKQKNVEWLLQQLAKYEREANRTWELHIVGDGPLKAHLEAAALSLRISDRVQWHGWLSKAELLLVYQKSHVLIHPALYEGMSNAVLEALACGLCILINRESLSEELLRATDRVVPYADDGEFHWRLAQFLRNGCSSRRDEPTTPFCWTRSAQRFIAHFS